LKFLIFSSGGFLVGGIGAMMIFTDYELLGLMKSHIRDRELNIEG
jgi:hypothetical protein